MSFGTGRYPKLCMMLLLAVLAMPGVAAAHDINVMPGFTRVIDVPGLTRVSLGNGAIAEVRALTDTEQVLIIGIEPGVSDIRVWSASGERRRYTLRVGSRKEKLTLAALRSVLDVVEGVRVERLRSDEFLLVGQALRPRDSKLAAALAERYPSQIVNQVTAPNVVMKPTVNIYAKVVEVRRSSLKDIGFDWSNTINGPSYAQVSDYATNDYFRTALPFQVQGGGPLLLPTDVGTQTYFGWATIFDSMIDLLANTGNARLLAEPQLSVVSGEDAEFLVGGEVPIPVPDGEGGIEIEYKEYGIILNIAPQADAAGAISAQVEVEVSSIDDSVTVNGYPGFVTRRTDTDVNLRNGESFVISGLLSNEESKDVNKVPGLGDIPILGELFKSRSFRNQETELLILVRPTVVTALSEANQRLLRKLDDLVKGSRDDVQFKLMD